MACSVQPNDQSWEQQASALESYPPSVKFVAKMLEMKGELTQSDLVEETLLPARTVRYAVNTLEDDGYLESRHYWKDARKRLYSLEVAAVEDSKTVNSNLYNPDDEIGRECREANQ